MPAPQEIKPLAWVTGAGGFIGHHLAHDAAGPGARWRKLPLDRQAVDLLDARAIRALLRAQPPQLIVHCAAMSRSPDCQKAPELARRINIEATRLLAGLAVGIPLVFLSTDLVFDGRRGQYIETDAVNPQTVYGETKAAAERLVLEHPQSLVLRTSLVYGSSPNGDRSFNEQLCRAWAAGQTTRLFTDEYRCPIPVDALARGLWELAAQQATGLYHLAGAERLSRWEIGQVLARLHPELAPRLETGSLKDFSGMTRSPDTSLNCAKAQARLPFPLPRFSALVV